MKRKITIVLFCALTTLSFAQNKIVKLSLEGKKYDNLYLLASTKGNQNSAVYGTSADGYNWTFSIPDTISNICSSYCIRSKNQQSSHIHFKTIVKNDTLIGGYFNFDEKEKLIDLKAKFDTTELFENKVYIEELDTTVVFQTWENDYFSIPFPKNRYLKEYMQTPMFCFFQDDMDTTKTYHQFLEEYANLIKQNPNSIYYISCLASTANYFSYFNVEGYKSDIKKMYELFSKKIQSSYFGKIVKNNFSRTLINNISQLPVDTLKLWNSDNYQKIILDRTKPTLLMFTASWCGPCRKKIPLFKEIYLEKGDKLDMVYISEDEDIKDWRKVMEKNEIKFRSLMLEKNDKLKKALEIISLPDYVLIYPNGTARKVQFKNEKDKETLYFIIN
jgi:thiol-disulfide isomerase/thioredoxin